MVVISLLTQLVFCLSFSLLSWDFMPRHFYGCGCASLFLRASSVGLKIFVNSLVTRTTFLDRFTPKFKEHYQGRAQDFSKGGAQAGGHPSSGGGSIYIQTRN